jgi:molybdenum cofactor biosynthesis protein A
MKHSGILYDSHQRFHNYLRISLIEKCNLRCTYCMPSAGIQLSPKESLMTSEEVYEIAKVFVHHGVNKIRLTGGEPLLRKDFGEILERLSTLKVSLALTTNGILLDRYLDDLKRAGLRKLNFSLDTLNPESFNTITLRDQFERVHTNLQIVLNEGFDVKINAVLLKGQNEEEIIDFIALTEREPLSIRFIEFMPFQGNAWDQSKTVSLASILERIEGHYGRDRVERLQDAPNDTAKNFKISGFKGSFAVISTVTNPFCDSCNRIRLTANGRLRNCLFSDKEQDLLGALRSGEPIEPVIQKVLQLKKAVRAGLDSPETFEDYHNHQSNRSMIKIGG